MKVCRQMVALVRGGECPCPVWIISFYHFIYCPVWISFYFALNTIFVAPPVYHLFVFVFSLVNVLSWTIKTEVVAESSMEMLFERFLWDFILGLDTAVPFESCWMFFGKASFHLIVPFSSVFSKVVEWMFLRRRLSTWRGRLFKEGKMRINDHSPFGWWSPYGKKVSDWKSGRGTQMEKKWKVLGDISHRVPWWYWIWFDDTWMQLLSFENCSLWSWVESVRVKRGEGGEMVLSRDLCVCRLQRSVTVIGWLAWLPSSFTSQLVSFHCLFSMCSFSLTINN